MYHIFFIHSSIDGHLGWFHILAIVNSAAINTGVHVSFLFSVFVFFRQIPRDGTAGSYGSSTWLNGIIDSMDMSLSKLQEIVKNKEAWYAASMGSERVRHDWATEKQWQFYF